MADLTKERNLDRKESIKLMEKACEILDYIAANAIDSDVSSEADYLAEQISNGYCDLMEDK